MKKTITVLVGTALALSLTSCMDGGKKDGAQKTGQAQTETAFKQQQAAVPYPVSALTDSTERRNIRERLLRFNQPSRLGYVYILSLTGTPIGYYAIKGKISNPDSQMTTADLVQRHSYGNVTVTAPGDDGSYGPNERGIFFFSTEGALIETSQEYLYSDQPIPAFINLPKLNGSKTVKDVSPR
jgi:hypothetical protein